MTKTFLFQAIQFSIRTQFSFIWPIDRTLSGATTPGQNKPGSDGSERVLRIYKISSSLEPHHQFVFCIIKDTRWVGANLFEKKQPVYSTAPADWAIRFLSTNETPHQSVEVSEVTEKARQSKSSQSHVDHILWCEGHRSQQVLAIGSND